MNASNNPSMGNTEIAHPSLFTFNVSKDFGKEYVDVFYDIARMMTIQITIQLMMYLTDNEKFPFFSIEFVLLCIYVVLGVLMYWLIFRKVITFE